MLGPTKRLARPAMAGTFACACVLFGAGCGAGTGDVAGQVTFNNKPVVYGAVMVIAADGLPRYAEIKEEGTYALKNVPCGPLRLAVNSPDPTTPLLARDPSKGPPPRAPELAKQLEALKKKWFPLPPKFGHPDTSNLTLDVHRGENPHDISLK